MLHDTNDGSGSSGQEALTLLEHASLAKIIVTGLSLGVVHVLTGPDHLSALATLSSGQSWRAFALGMQWGYGHSLGIILVAAMVLVLGHTLALGDLREVFSYVAGAFLILLGLYTLYHAHVEYDANTRPASKWESVQCQDATYMLIDTENGEGMNYYSHRSMQTSASLCVGLIHGVAGPGGILGVLPIVAMHHQLLHAVVYLACFCGSSILCMGAFAAFYGEITRRSSLQSALLTFRIAVASSALSIVVGLLWIILQACGVLDHVFGHHN